MAILVRAYPKSNGTLVFFDYVCLPSVLASYAHGKLTSVTETVGWWRALHQGTPNRDRQHPAVQLVMTPVSDRVFAFDSHLMSP